MLNFIHMIDIQERELYFGVFIKNMFRTGMRSDTYEPNYFKLGMMIDLT